MTPDPLDGWKIARGSGAINIYNPSGRRLLSIRETGNGLTVTTHTRGVVPLDVLRRAMALAVAKEEA